MDSAKLVVTGSLSFVFETLYSVFKGRVTPEYLKEREELFNIREVGDASGNAYRSNSSRGNASSPHSFFSGKSQQSSTFDRHGYNENIPYSSYPDHFMTR